MPQRTWSRIAKLGRIALGRAALIACRLRLGRSGLPSDLQLAFSAHISATDGGQISFGRRCSVARNATVVVKHGSIDIGQCSEIGIGSVVTARESVTIGDHVLIAEYVTIRDQDHSLHATAEGRRMGFTTAPVTICDGVWIGAKVTITKGVTIGKNSVVGANSVVTSDIPPNVVAAGIPARVLRQLADPSLAPSEPGHQGAGL